MKLLVGLGNPGPRYETTRHNAGFLVLDYIAEKFEIPWSGSKFDASVAKGNVLDETCILIKPMTMMNLSGRSVAQFARFFKMEPKDIVVLHDEVDCEPGKVKARVGGGHGGHNGIRNIIDELGSADFHRIKLGVGKPENTENGVTDWVLNEFFDEELLALENEVLAEALVRLKSIFDSQQ